jgi:hypothetical protein
MDRFPAGAETFFSVLHPNRLRFRPSLVTSGYRRGAEWQRHEADNPPASNDEFTNVLELSLHAMLLRGLLLNYAHTQLSPEASATNCSPQ